MAAWVWYPESARTGHASLREVWLAALMAVGGESAYTEAMTEPTAGSDRTDVQASQNGDGQAYARLVKRYQGQVATRMWKFTRDPQQLDELVHDVFVEAYFSLGRYREMGAFGGWLYRIATRVGYQFWKDQKRASRQAPMADWEPVSDEAPTDAEEAADRLHTLLAQLGPRDRLVLTLVYWEQLTVAQAAQQAGWSQTMVKVQLHRARKRLKKLLDKQAR